MTFLAVSHGGGVQTTALLVLAAQGEIPHRLFVFANVGDQAENPETLRYHRYEAMPYAAAHGLDLIERRWVSRGNRQRDLYVDLLAAKKDIPIPVRLASGAFGNRKCTERYKIGVVAREMRSRGATVDDPAEVAIGFSTDELERANPGVDKVYPWTVKTHPLLDLGLSRSDCRRIITDAGLPVPPKSSCWFCPFQSGESWQQRRRNQPELFAAAAELEDRLNERRAELGRDRVGLASAKAPLAQAVWDGDEMFGPDRCGGSCFT